MSRGTGRSEPDSAYAALAALSSDLPAAHVLTELLRQLAAATNARVVRVWRVHDGGFTPALTWPADAIGVPDVPATARLEGGPGVDGMALIADGASTLGAVTITTRGRSVVTGEGRRRLRDTANCVLLVWRRDELRTVLHRQIRHTDRLGGELADSERRLSTVRDLERRRVATEIITLSTGRLGRLHQEVDQLGADLGAGLLPDVSSAGRLRDLLDELIEDFRVMVRGIHPQVLQSRGPRAALADVAAGLSRPARITGAVPARIDPELGAALYFLTAAALQTLAPTDGEGALEVHLSHTDGLLGSLITGRARISTAALRAALTVDVDRLAALGGGAEVTVEDAAVSLRAWVPDRLEPAAAAPRELPSSLPARVRALALGLAAGYGDGPGSGQAQALVTRLDGPVRVGVPGLPGHELGSRADWLTGVGRRLPDLVLVPSSPYSPDEPADWLGLPDVVLQPTSADPEQRVDVVLIGAGLLVRSAPWAELPDLLITEVVARADLLRARSVLAALIVLRRSVPLAGPPAERFGYELEELQAGAHELVELEALAQLRTGQLDLTRAQLRTAERLLGCTGPAPYERLGLPASATPDELRWAAQEQMAPWRGLAENAAAGRRQRQACAMIVRCCEALLAE
jgi:hypothetical protein